MSHSMKRTDEAIWSEFVAEARALLAVAPEMMSAEQLDRLGFEAVRVQEFRLDAPFFVVTGRKPGG